MSNPVESVEILYPSYNGISREVLFMGVPLMAMVLLSTVILFVVFGCAVAWGMIGILAVVPFIPVIIFIRQITQTDNNAVGVLALEIWFLIKYRWLRPANFKAFSNTVTFTTTGYTSHVNDIKSTFEKPIIRKG
jgi:type IV secretion system protein VirB3